MGSSASSVATPGLPPVSLAEFNAAWPEAESRLTLDAAAKVLQVLLLPRGITDKEKIRRAVLDRANSGLLPRRTVLEALVSFANVDVSKSLGGVASDEGGDPTKLLLEYANLRYPENVVSALEGRSALTRLSLRGNSELLVADNILLHLPASLEELDISGTRCELRFHVSPERRELEGLHCASRSMRDALVRLKNLRVLTVRGVLYADDLPVVLEGVRQSNLVELNVEDTNCACDVELSDMVRVCESLRTLSISENARLQGANATCLAVYQSKVQRFEARKLGEGIQDASLVALASAPRLLFLDLRGTNLNPPQVSLFLAQMRISTNLYSLKLTAVPMEAAFDMLGSNTTLGIFCASLAGFGPAMYGHALQRALDDAAAKLVDNCSLFILDPLPERCNRLRALISSNYLIAKRVRQLILLILAAHKLHRHESDFGVFPKDMIVLIMKHLWATRQDRAWNALRQ